MSTREINPLPAHERRPDAPTVVHQHDDHACAGMVGACGHGGTFADEEQFFRSLPEGHVVRTLMVEHTHIRRILDSLEAGAAALAARAGDVHVIARKMREGGEKLAAAEPHHVREEHVLFAELEARGVFGPPQVMTAEHVELRRMKHAVIDTATALAGGDESARMAAVEAARAVVTNLRMHIAKENGILYPLALGVIRDDSVWQDMRRRCDAIGYCCTALHA